MVLEYVEGGDCGTLLKNVGGPLSFDLARSSLCKRAFHQIILVNGIMFLNLLIYSIFSLGSCSTAHLSSRPDHWDGLC